MATERLEFGSAPYDEDCAQVGTPGYREQAEAECQRYIEQLTRQSPPPAGARLVITRNPHDFGTYLEVAASFDPEDEEQSNWAYTLEDNLPANWDSSEAGASESPTDIV